MLSASAWVGIYSEENVVVNSLLNIIIICIHPVPLTLSSRGSNLKIKNDSIILGVKVPTVCMNL